MFPRRFLLMISLAFAHSLFAYNHTSNQDSEDEELASKKEIINFLARVRVRLKYEMNATTSTGDPVLLSKVFAKIYDSYKDYDFRNQMFNSLEGKVSKSLLKKEKFIRSYIQNLLLVFLEEEQEEEEEEEEEQ